MGNLLIYKSSAGSGKTYTLAKEYVKLALRSPDYFKRILAITFTNKATQEMQSRILMFLKQLSENNNPELLKTLQDEGVGENIPERATKTFESILHNYSYFSVSTIDSFFNKILRSFAKELGLSAGFEIEMNNDEILVDIVSQLWNESMTDDELLKYLKSYITDLLNSDSGWNIDGIIQNLAKEIFRERYYEKKFNRPQDFSESKEKLRNFIDTINNLIKDYEATFLKYSELAKEQINKHNLNQTDFKNGKRSALVWLVDNVPTGNYKISAAARDTLNGESGWYSKTSKLKNEIASCFNDGLSDIFFNLIKFEEENIRSYFTALEIKKTIYTLGIFSDILKLLADYRNQENILFQQDVNIILRKLIEKDNIPFIYEKTGNKYEHFLIDEFQDTSDFQWKNLKPLLDNSLAEEKTSVIVGDDKQAIYRWREGNAELLTKGIENDFEHYNTMLKKIPLKSNFRSKKNIIDFNNYFFGKLYPDSEQLYKNKNNEGFVKICFHQPDTGEFKTSTRVIINENTLNYIKDVLNSGYDKKDILILVRNSNDGTEIANYLSSNGIEIISSETLQVNSSPKVNFIINALRYICDNKNVVAETELILNYAKYITSENINYNILFSENNKEWIESKIFSKITKGLNDLTVYETVEEIIRRFSFENIHDSYMSKLLELVFKFQNTESSNTKSFLLNWDKFYYKEKISIPEEIDAVKILTIHKAKGLQSPVVIIPYADWEMNVEPNKGFIWTSTDVKPFDEFPDYLVKSGESLLKTYFENDFIIENEKTERDNINLLYVAFTRPIEMLFVNAVLKKESTSDKKHKDNAGDIIYSNITSNPELSPYLVGLEFIYGNKDQKKLTVGTKSKETINAVETELTYISSEWYKKTVIKTDEHKIKPWETGYNESNFGDTVHKILSKIKYAQDFESAITEFIKNGSLPESRAEGLKLILSKLINDEKTKNWFLNDWIVHNETEIILPNGDFIRPDRVIYKEDKSIVIDYKTGSENIKYENQINKYSEALKNMGFADVKKFLLYIPSTFDKEFYVKEVL